MTRRSPMARLELIAPEGFPLIAPGDRLSDIICATLTSNNLALVDGDIVVLAQKIVSKAEDRFVELSEVKASNEAEKLAAICGKDPRLVELILTESTAVVRCCPGVIIVRHRLGWVMANAGIDHSNVLQPAAGERVLLLPRDPDRSARTIRHGLTAATGTQVGVMIIDSFGRAWRLGTCGVCIGAAGITTVQDLRGTLDLLRRPLVSTVLGRGDEIAAAASVLMGQADEGRPLVLVRGLAHDANGGSARDLIRPADQDLFL